MKGNILAVGFCVVASVSSLLARTAHAESFYIDEMTDWTGNGCEAEDLNECTSLLTNHLKTDGWTGSRFVNPDAWPQDIIESCDASTYGANGQDDQFGDGANLLVIDGHGNTGFIAFASKREGKCTVDLGSSTNLKTRGVARLGEMGGATASVAMWLTCCTLKKESLKSHANKQWLRQQLGFHGESLLDKDMPLEFYNDNWTESNRDAWLDAMEDASGWFTGDNSPMVVTYGHTSAEATDNDNHMYLRHNVQFPRPDGPVCTAGLPRYYYTATYLDHGSDGCD